MEHLIKHIQVLGGRLCHDLATPIGALSMGLEMLGDQPALPAQQEIINLVNGSLDNTKIRLELFRYLVGYGQSEERPILNEIVPWLQRYWKETRLQFQTEGPLELCGTSARLALALILAASEAMPRGGTLTVGVSSAILQINLNGPHIDVSEEMQTVMANDTLIPSARTVFAWYAGLLAKTLSLKIISELNPPSQAQFSVA